MINSCQEVKKKSEMPLVCILTHNSIPVTITAPLSVTSAGKDLLGGGLTQ